MKNKKLVFVIFFLFGIFAFSGQSLAAYKCSGGPQCTPTNQAACVAISGCSWVSDANNNNSSSCTTCLPNPLGVTSVNALIGKVINAVLGVVGSLALLMFIYGGLTWMTSSGSADKVKKGKDILVWSILGMAVIFASYGLVNFVLGNLTS